jgi:hypothetical protein
MTVQYLLEFSFAKKEEASKCMCGDRDLCIAVTSCTAFTRTALYIAAAWHAISQA